MFDVSWTDPARETVGERRNRKEQNGGPSRKQNVISRKSSMRSSKSSSETAGKPSLLNIFSPGPSKKANVERTALPSKLNQEDANDRRTSSYTTGSETSGNELSSTTATTRDSATEASEGRDCHSDTEQSNPSEGQCHLLDDFFDNANMIISPRISVLWMDWEVHADRLELERRH